MSHVDNAIYISDYTRPGDLDSAAGIRAAIQDAARLRGAATIIFEPGRYLLSSTHAVRTAGMVHDAGSGSQEWKECHLSIRSISGLTLAGASEEQGEPATVLVGYNDGSVHGHLPSILWCEDCDSLTLRHLAFTREPAYASAGVITAKSSDSITVEVFQGNPCWDGMGTYCMNRFDPLTGALRGESVTYGHGAGVNWQQTGERTLTLHSVAVAAQVHLGEHLSWHQGAQTDFQTYFARCDGLLLIALRIMNANGFAMLTESCRGLRADQIVFKPDGRRLFTAPRDAWKLFKCGGDIEVSRLYVEGVRMDGQNMHSNWLTLLGCESPLVALFHCKYTFAALLVGSEIEFYEKEHMEKRVIRSWEHAGVQDGGHLYRIVFDSPLPMNVVVGSLCAAACWEADSYTCSDSQFINIAGAGHLIRYDNVSILNCTYINTMNPGVLLGAELPIHGEGGHATNIRIADCLFENCGFVPRYGAGGCIGIKSAGFSGPYNRHITIQNNTFRYSAIGIHAIDASDVTLAGNIFDHVEHPLQTEPGVTGLVHWI